MFSESPENMSILLYKFKNESADSLIATNDRGEMLFDLREALHDLDDEGKKLADFYFSAQGVGLHEVFRNIIPSFFIINDKGEILDFVLTPGNTDDRKPLSGTNLLSRIHGKLFGDKGYISKTLFEQLFIFHGIYRWMCIDHSPRQSGCHIPKPGRNKIKKWDNGQRLSTL